MHIAEFGLTGISYKKGLLFGVYKQYPLATLRFLFVTISFFKDDNTKSLMREALAGLAQDRDWLVKNAPRIRMETRKAEARAEAKAEHHYKASRDEYKALYLKGEQELAVLKAQNDALRSSIKIVSAEEV